MTSFIMMILALFTVFLIVSKKIKSKTIKLTLMCWENSIGTKRSQFKLNLRMLILYESSVGYSLFRVLDEDKLKNVDNIYREFESQNSRSNFIQLHAFQAFKDMDEAKEAAKCIGEGMCF